LEISGLRVAGTGRIHPFRVGTSAIRIQLRLGVPIQTRPARLRNIRQLYAGLTRSNRAPLLRFLPLQRTQSRRTDRKMPAPDRSRFDVQCAVRVSLERESSANLVPAVLRRRTRWVQSSVWQLRSFLGCLDLSLDSGAVTTFVDSAVEASRRRQSCQRRVHYSQTLD